MKKPRLLDVCCGAGGAATGYARAGFDVVGVDICPQPHYPFPFIQADALTVTLEGFDAYHASCPCQCFTLMLTLNPTAREKHADIIAPMRARFQATGKPYILENVIGAPLDNPVMLCGAMFGLRVYRHRPFESNLLLFQPQHPKHRFRAARPGKIPAPDEYWCPVGRFGHKDEAQKAMGIDWMQTSGHSNEIAQAIPPAYTEWLGRQMMDVLQHQVA